MTSKQTTRYFGLRLHPGWTPKKGTEGMVAIVHATGVPKTHSHVVAWFAERLILLGVIIAAASFVAGVLFNLYFAQPLAESEVYNVFVAKAALAKAQIIDVGSYVFSKLMNDNHETPAELAQAVLAQRKQQIKQYLISKRSPFAADNTALTALVNAKNMKLILAISFVESNFGKHCYFYNCSGIGGTPPNLRKYTSYADWIADFDNLLESRYKGLAPEKFIGLYVQPGSPNWIYGVNQVLNEFAELEIV